MKSYKFNQSKLFHLTMKELKTVKKFRNLVCVQSYSSFINENMICLRMLVQENYSMK